MEHIDKVVYINLDHREDRNKDMEEELTRLCVPEEKRLRISAIKWNPGWIGCLKSHIAVLQMAKEAGWSNVLLLEDDFMAIVSPEEFQEELHRFFSAKIHADVVFLSYNIKKSGPFNECMGRAIDCQTASGYLVFSHYYDTLLQNLSEADTLAIQYPSHHCIYANDQYWKKLQVKDTWLYFLKRLGKQRPGFSDLGRCHVNYGV